MDNLEKKAARLREMQEKLHAYKHAISLLSYDSQTAMPSLGHAGGSHTASILSGEQFALMVSPERRELLEELYENRDKLDHITCRDVEEQLEALKKSERIPADEFAAFTRIKGEAMGCWLRAKEENDFSLFLPALQQVLEASEKMAVYEDPDLAPYDALLGKYEKGLTTKILDPFFSQVRQTLVPLLHAISEKGEQPDMTPFRGHFPLEAQKRISRELMDTMTLDPRKVSLGQVEHPFTTSFNRCDVRLTTHYHEDDLFSAFFSVGHEGGHSLYEQNIGEELDGTYIGQSSSISIHESQSRFFENMICRSRGFLTYMLPKLRREFPDQLQGVTEDHFYRAANRVEPGLIRLDADELSYSLHVMVRYEIEKALFDGSLRARDIPEAWNRLYREYLGVDVPDDRRGCLQDSHWADGYLGYFPTYSLGSAYAAQMYAHMEEDLPVEDLAARGQLEPVVDWLRQRIYRFGMLKKPEEMLTEALGGAFSPAFYTRYLEGKFTELYNL